MLAEQIHNANPDQGEGRVMSDSSSMFVLYVLELLNWDNDLATVQLYVLVPSHFITTHLTQTYFVYIWPIPHV